MALKNEDEGLAKWAADLEARALDAIAPGKSVLETSRQQAQSFLRIRIPKKYIELIAPTAKPSKNGWWHNPYD